MTRRPTTYEARAVMNNPSHRPEKKIHEVNDLLTFMPHTIPQAVSSNQYSLKVWYDVLPNLIDKGIVHHNDLDGFIIYCTAVGNYHRAAEELAMDEFVIRSESREGHIRVNKNPLLEIMKAMESVALRWGREFGLTPLSRGNVKVGRTSEKSKLSEFTQ
jgi:P27 family predicted phage terminase small subunit